jgi:hypothetical protein
LNDGIVDFFRKLDLNIMIKKFFKYIFHLISRFIYLLIPIEIRDFKQERNIDRLIHGNTKKECYEHFKEIFKTTILFRDFESIRKYAIKKAISNDKQKELIYLEFSV